MKTGTKKVKQVKKKKNNLLRAAILVCLFFATYRLGEFVYSRIPPHSEGVCIKPAEFFIVKIEENHIIDGYSIVGINMLGTRAKAKASFEELRSAEYPEISCEDY